MTTFLIIVFTIVAMAGFAIALARQGHGESSSGHRMRTEDPESDSMVRAPGSRPGGPGQAGQAVVSPGEIAPADPQGRSEP
jgi:hypothetical protein